MNSQRSTNGEMLAHMRKELNSKISERDLLNKQLQKSEAELELTNTRLHAQEKARGVLQEAAVRTQESIEYHFSSVTTSALQAVFGDELEFVVSFDQKRGRTECHLQFKSKDGHIDDPIGSDGGGAINVASFALQTAFLAIKKPRPVLILDEPMHWLDRDRMPRAAEVIKTMTEKMGLQVIMVSHEPEFIEQADKVFHTKKGGDGMSHVTVKRDASIEQTS